VRHGLRHHIDPFELFPDESSVLVQADASAGYTMAFAIEAMHLPFFLRNRVSRTKSLEVSSSRKPMPGPL